MSKYRTAFLLKHCVQVAVTLILFFHISGCGSEANNQSAALSVTDGNLITVRARGNQGAETINLTVNGSVVRSWAVTTVFRTFSYTTMQTVESLRVGYNSGNWPNVVVVDYVTVNGTRYESEGPSTFSSGSWDDVNGCAKGYKLTQRLSCDGGYFQYRIGGDNRSNPGDAAAHLAMLKATPYRNMNHDSSQYVATPSANLPLAYFLVPWQNYEAAGGITKPILGSGSFRVYCEFSHLAYDDPIVFPNQPGVAHLHMFFGNTDTNAFSTADSLLNSGSSTCNGEELNRTAYWVPAFIDASGNVPVPDDALVYYKSYYGPDSSSGLTEVYPQGMRLISGVSMATAPQPGHTNFRELFFRCYKPGTGGSDPVNTKSAAIPNCPDNSYLEMNIKFQTCWNGRNPADYRNNAAYSDVWPTSGSCPASHPRKLPQMEYRIFFRDHAGSENWILSSDVNMVDQQTVVGRGYSLHGDWFGGWNREINQRWIDNCVNIVDTDCDDGLLADPRRDPSAQGLKIRQQYSGAMRVPGDVILRDLCPANKHFSGQASVALCQPGQI